LQSRRDTRQVDTTSDEDEDTPRDGSHPERKMARKDQQHDVTKGKGGWYEAFELQSRHLKAEFKESFRTDCEASAKFYMDIQTETRRVEYIGDSTAHAMNRFHSVSIVATCFLTFWRY